MFELNDNILVYPVDRGILSVIKSTENYLNINISQLVSLESWGHNGECYSCARGMVEISHDFHEGLNHCTTVWIVDSWNDLDFYKYIEPKIRLAVNNGKRIICSRYLTTLEKTVLSDIEIFYVEYSSINSLINNDSRVYEIRTPVIFVMSTTEFCNQFFIETAIYAELRNRGYNTLLISSQKEGVLFGGCSVPDFMFNNDYPENKKIIGFNHYTYSLEIEQKPDVIVIGVPGAAMPYNHQYVSDFGVIAYEISEAVKPDFSVLSHPCMPYYDTFFKGIDKCLQGRLGVSIDIHSLSPYALDFYEPAPVKRLAYLSVDASHVHSTIEKLSTENLLNLNTMTGISSAIDKMISQLSDGTSSIII